MPHRHELPIELRDMLIHPTGVSEVEWRYKQDFHGQLLAFSYQLSAISRQAGTDTEGIPASAQIAIANSQS